MAPAEPAEPQAYSLDRHVPAALGKYRVLAELGRGGMSNVFLALARGASGVNKLVVLKALLPELATEPDSLEMFLQEARLAARLNHPNVVQSYDVGREGNHHVIVMEYLEGQILQALIQRGRPDKSFPLGMHLSIIVSVLEGLHYAHELTDYDGKPLLLVHRDISPHNVFVTYDGQVKLLDFGIAKVVNASAHTADGIFKGKVRYMAPEQMTGEVIDRRADIFAVGATLWEAAAGRRLWENVPEGRVLNHVLNGEIPLPRTVNPDVDPELERIVMKALAASPDSRYGTALELQADIEALLEAQGSGFRQKQIGKYVSDRFGALREKVREVIERQVSCLEALPSGDYQAVLAHAMPRERTTGLALTPKSGFGPAPEATIEARRNHPALYVALVALVGVALLAVFVIRRLGVGVPAPIASGLRPVAQTESTPEPPRQIAIQLVATPVEATLFFDDEAQPSNPTLKMLPADGTSHKVRAEAAGYLPKTSDVALDRDQSVSLALEREPASVATSLKPRSVHPRATPTVAVAVPPKPNCDQPFFIDDRGIKRMRRECL